MISKVSEVISYPIEMAVLGGASTAFSIAGNPRTTQPPNAEQKSQSFLPLSDKALAFSVVLKGMPTNHFSFVGTHFKTHLGFQRDGKFLWLWVSNRGEERPVGWGNQRGQSSLGSGFQRRQRCLGGRHPMEGRAFLAGRIQRNRGFVAHDFARKV